MKSLRIPLTVLLAGSVLTLSSCLSLFSGNAASASSQQPAPEPAPAETDDPQYHLLSGHALLPALGVRFIGDPKLNKGLLVDGLQPGAPAEDFLQPGDVVRTLNGSPLSTWEAFHAELLGMGPGEQATLDITRAGTALTVSFPLTMLKTEVDVVEIVELLAAGNEVRVAVIVGETGQYGFDEEESGNWSEGVALWAASQEESRCLYFFSRHEKFSLVDRRTIETILEEQNLGLTGMVDDPARVGILAGATHVLDISYLRMKDVTARRGYRDDITRRLLDVETGRVLATVRGSYF